jgi:hypothetical protein
LGNALLTACFLGLLTAGGAAQGGQGDAAGAGAAQQESEEQAELRRWYTDRVGEGLFGGDQGTVDGGMGGYLAKVG